MDGEPQKTRASLLLSLRDLDNKVAWQQFIEIYTQIIYGYCHRRGLQDADAADVTQEVMRSVVGAIQKFEYDAERGRFRSWLLQITRNKLNTHLAKQQRHPQPSSPSTIQALLDLDQESSEDPSWDQEYNHRIFQWASKRVRPWFRNGSWEAFWRVTINGEDPKNVAASLEMSLGAVYIAKSRILSRLREEIETLDGQEVLPTQP